jgi:hypothetical protein
LACGDSIRTHYGHRSTWLGCQAKGLQENTTFILVPARRRVDARIVKTVVKAMEEVKGQQVIRVRAKRTAPTTPYVYTVKDRRKKVDDQLTGAKLDAFTVLKRNRRPLDVRTVAEKSEHPKETTQQLLKFLVDHGYATRMPMDGHSA